MWGLSFATHRYLIEALSGQHALSMLITRYVKFIQSIRKSPKIAVQFLLQKVLKNCSTLTGKNVRYVLEQTDSENIFDVSPNAIKKEFKFCEMKKEDAWRVNLVKEMINIRQKVLTLDQNEHALSNEEMEEILDYVCST